MSLIVRPKLGLNPSDPKNLVRTLKLSHYLVGANGGAFAEFIPSAFDWFAGVPDYMDLNDRIGDCVVATQAKMVRSWTANVGKAVTITDAMIRDEYMDGAGYNPDDPTTDRGWDMLSGLSYWQRIGIGGHKIGAYAAINPRHRYMMQAGAFLFGGIYTAFELPNSIWNQMDAGLPWDVEADDGGPAGGHCVTIQRINHKGNPCCRTWGAEQEMTWPFVFKYCVEAYAAISNEYFYGGVTIAGLDITRLTADLTAVKA
jgi:hypothetical protein